MSALDAARSAWLEQLPGLAWWCAADGRAWSGSSRWLAYTGGGAWLDAVEPAQRAETEARWRAALARGGALEHDLRLRRRDGSYRWFRQLLAPLHDARARLEGYLALHTDIDALRGPPGTATGRLALLTDQFRNAERVAGTGSFELDVATGEITCSEELYRILGTEPAAGAARYRIGQPLPLLEPESQQRLERALERAVREGVGYEVWIDGRRPSGEPRQWIARGEPVGDELGKIQRIVGTLQDVTQREQVARQLRTLTERLQLATSAARLGVWDWDIGRDLLVWDPAMLSLYGWPASTLGVDRQRWLAAVHAEDRPALERALQDAVAGVREFSTSFRVLTPDGTVRYVRATANTSRALNGRALRMVGVQLDISEQRTAEQALREHEALQSAVLRSAGVSIIAMDVRGLIKLYNRTAEELLGVPAQEVVGRRDAAFAHDPEELAQHRCELEQELGCRLSAPIDVLVARARADLTEAREWTYVCRDGRRIPVLLTVTALRDAQGDVNGYLSVGVELSQRKRYERELLELNELLGERSQQAEAASRAKSSFVANVSHELRTPLAAISGMSYLLGRTALDEEQRALLTTIERASKALALMVSDILDVSKIEANQLALESQPFTVAALLDELRGVMAGFALGKPLELIIDTDGSCATMLLGDRGRLLQVLTNLLSNAIKFSATGSVQLRFRALDPLQGVRWVRFEVEDTGPGIDAAARGGLFEPFHRLSDATSRRVGGSGLGLAIVKQLSQLMGGRVGVESEPGRGSTFWCELPFERAGASQPSEPRELTASVLVVEGHDAQRAALVASARLLGASVLSARSMAEASGLLRERAREERPIDCLILDRGLPHAEVSEALAQSAPRPCVVLLGAQDGERDTLLAPLAQVVLGKPVTPTALRAALQRALTARWTRRPPPVLRARAPQTSARLCSVKALVVDDSEVNREIAQRILAREGAEVALAAEGARALELVGQQRFDVVLMDIQLPGDMDGSDVVRHMRGHTAVPVLALTASALASDRERALAAGMSTFVSKPFDPEALIATVRELVERARGQPLPAGAAEAVPVPRPWPLVEGIDRVESEHRLCGDRELFRALLGRVLQELEAFVLGLAQRAPDPVPLARALHRLGGMCGNIGARKIWELLQAAQQALAAGDPHALAQQLDRLPGELRRIQDGARTFLRGSSRPPPPSGLLSGELGLQLDALLALLHAQDLDALPLLDELGGRLSEALGEERSRRLRAAVDQLDFALAATLLAHSA